MKKNLRILVIEDVAEDVVLMEHALRKGGINAKTQRVENRIDFLNELQHALPDVILSDHGLPSFDGFTALALARERCPEVPFIFVTGTLGEEMAIETFESGATDYVLKNRLNTHLVPAVERALREADERARRRQAEAALRESNARNRMLVESVEDYAILLLDPDGRVATWNAGAERQTGYQALEIIGHPMARFFTSADIATGRPARALQIAFADGHYREECWNLRKDGSRYRVDLLITALRNESGRLYGYSQISRDITERKQAEDETRRLNAELEQRIIERTAQLEMASQELEAFSYSVSNDLRAPLRHISGFVELLQARTVEVLRESERDILQTIADESKQMGRLIDDLLDFSRFGRVEMRMNQVSLSDLVQEVMCDLRHHTAGREVVWQIGMLPEVWGDPVLLRQALLNLLANAVKFTRPRPFARIEMGSLATAGETLCYVRDNGVGFDMKHAGKLFGVFQRLHRPAEFDGTGIGLANVRRIISRHGGRTWAEARPDDGATFFFTLPGSADDYFARRQLSPVAG